MKSDATRAIANPNKFIRENHFSLSKCLKATFIDVLIIIFYPIIKLKSIYVLIHILKLNHSYRRAFEGLARAAFNVWKLTVIKVIVSNRMPDAIKTHQGKLILKA